MRTCSPAFSRVLVLPDLLGALGVAAQPFLVGRDRLRPDLAADEDGEDHEEQPAEDGLAAMLRAPTAGASSEALFCTVTLLGEGR
jgi:hypothetical protein